MDPGIMIQEEGWCVFWAICREIKFSLKKKGDYFVFFIPGPWTHCQKSVFYFFPALRTFFFKKNPGSPFFLNEPGIPLCSRFARR